MAEDRQAARADAAREKTQRAAKRAITEGGGDFDRAATIFLKDAGRDSAIMEHALQFFLDAVSRDRPDLKDDPDALAAEAVRRLRTLAKKRIKPRGA